MQGTQPKLVEVAEQDGGLVAEYEARKRLEARHDPTRSSACRLCGIVVEPFAGNNGISNSGATNSGHTSPDGAEAGGWKVCTECVPLIRLGLPAVWSSVLAPLPIPVNWREAEAMPNPAYFLTGWPTDPGNATRWEHVDIEEARVRLTKLRQPTTARFNPSRTGCRWCGVNRSLTWTAAGQWGRDRQSPKAYLCGGCAPWWQRSGQESWASWRTSLFACCVGLDHAVMDLHFGLKAFHESGADRSGTDEPWAYLGSVRQELRAKIIRTRPRRVTLTEQERRVLAVEAEIAAAKHARPERKLADLP